jgi:AcrR family transcriptional regulator
MSTTQPGIRSSGRDTGVPPEGPTSARPAGQRRDVTRNRAKHLAAADEVIRTRGGGATIEAIAHQAGLGVGTGYRHFANKQALLQALFVTRIERVLQLLDRAGDIDEPGEALDWFLREAVAMQVGDRGLRESLSPSAAFEALDGHRERLVAGTQVLVDRARAAGAVRPDLEATDIPIVFTMVGAVADLAGEVDDQLWRRYLDLLLDGIRPPTVTRRLLPGGALRPDQIRSAMQDRR